MIKNSHIHLVLETEHLKKLKQKSKEVGLSLSEFCRSKLLESDKLDKIEYLLEQVLRKNGL